MTEVNDTASIVFNDDSWIWFDEYVNWRINYILWNNKQNFDTSEPLKLIILHQEGDGITHEAVLDPIAIRTIMDAFDYNPRFQRVSEYFLNEFNPDEVMAIRDANSAMNEFYGDSIQFTKMFFNLSRCEDSCQAYDRLVVLIEMVEEIGLTDFFSHEKLDASNFVIKMNEVMKLANQPVIRIK